MSCVRTRRYTVPEPSPDELEPAIPEDSTLPAANGKVMLQGGFTRRALLGGAAKIGAVGAAIGGVPLATLASRAAPGATSFTDTQRRTLDAALARMIPADGPNDWSAVDAGARAYIEKLLFGPGDIYAGGPTRDHFPEFQPLSRVKEMGWGSEVQRLRRVYAEGLVELDRRAGGSFAAAPEALQDVILETLDLEGSPFFAALYAHTMEGVYSHPVYGGNTEFVAWKEYCYQGDVHGVRFPTHGSTGSWNTYGGYAPEEMAGPGECPGQGPSQ